MFDARIRERIDTNNIGKALFSIVLTSEILAREQFMNPGRRTSAVGSRYERAGEGTADREDSVRGTCNSMRYSATVNCIEEL
jgi:hypothetical protein